MSNKARIGFLFMFIFRTVNSQPTIEQNSVCADLSKTDVRLQVGRSEVEEDTRRRELEILKLKEEIRRKDEDMDRILKSMKSLRDRAKRCGYSNSTLNVSCNGVSGITKGMGNVYVLCNSKSLEVFEDAPGFRRLNSISLSMVSVPYDIVFHNASQSFFISDNSTQCIWRVSIHSNGGAQVTRWLPGVTYPSTLSLTKEGRLLLARHGARSSQLEVYDGLGQSSSLIQVVMFPETVTRPLHAIETPDGNFIVGHQWKTNQTWTVTKLNQNGEILRSFVANSREQNLEQPWHLALDPEDGRLFVADYRKNRVVTLNAETLVWDKVILTGNYWWKLLYDNEKLQVLAGDWFGKAVTVLTV